MTAGLGFMESLSACRSCGFAIRAGWGLRPLNVVNLLFE